MRNLFIKQVNTVLDGKAFRKLRRSHEITLEAVAAKAPLAISHLSKIERGILIATDQTGERLVSALEKCIKEKREE